MAIFTQTGEDFITDLVDGTTTKPANYYIGWGTGATAEAKANTALATESAEARVAATLTQPTSDTNRFVSTITASAARAITEAGVFTASTAGIMVLRSLFSVINLASGDSIQFTFDLNWS